MTVSSLLLKTTMQFRRSALRSEQCKDAVQFFKRAANRSER
jgi:hypothetical protein